MLEPPKPGTTPGLRLRRPTEPAKINLTFEDKLQAKLINSAEHWFADDNNSSRVLDSLGPIIGVTKVNELRVGVDYSVETLDQTVLARLRRFNDSKLPWTCGISEISELEEDKQKEILIVFSTATSPQQYALVAGSIGQISFPLPAIDVTQAGLLRDDPSFKMATILNQWFAKQQDLIIETMGKDARFPIFMAHSMTLEWRNVIWGSEDIRKWYRISDDIVIKNPSELKSPANINPTIEIRSAGATVESLLVPFPAVSYSQLSKMKPMLVELAFSIDTSLEKRFRDFSKELIAIIDPSTFKQFQRKSGYSDFVETAANIAALIGLDADKKFTAFDARLGIKGVEESAKRYKIAQQKPVADILLKLMRSALEELHTIQPLSSGERTSLAAFIQSIRIKTSAGKLADAAKDIQIRLEGGSIPEAAKGVFQRLLNSLTV